MRRLPPEYTGFLAKTDGRTVAARQLKVRTAAVVADLGGAKALSYAQQSLIRRAVFLEARVEAAEAQLARGKPVNLAEHLAAINTLRALWQALGLRRQARELSLSDYLQQEQPHED